MHFTHVHATMHYSLFRRRLSLPLMLLSEEEALFNDARTLHRVNNSLDPHALYIKLLAPPNERTNERASCEL